MVAKLVRYFKVGKLAFKILSKVSPTKDNHPRVAIEVFRDAPGYRIVGGGGRVIYDESEGEAGAFLTAMFPEEDHTRPGGTWVVQSKDHQEEFSHHVIAYAVCAAIAPPPPHSGVDEDLDGILIPQEMYYVFSKKSDIAYDNPSKFVEFPKNPKDEKKAFVLVGGGVKTHSTTGAGQLLVKSCPKANGWQAASKAHEISDPAKITVFAIGLRQDFLDSMEVRIKRSEFLFAGPNISVRQGHPRTEETIPGWLIGGGADDQFTGAGNMLTGSFPNEKSKLWQVEGKDHIFPDPAIIAAYAIGVTDKHCDVCP